MKQCPVCKTTYTDETLRFCLNDGTNLVSLPDVAETVQMSFDKNPVRINIPPDSTPTVFTPPISNQPVKKGVSPAVVGILVGLLVIMIIGFAAFAAYVAFKSDDDKNTIVANSTKPTPTASQTATPDDQNAELKEKLANLEKQVQDQKNRKNKTTVETFSTPQSSTITTARVNSPGDGFLALRTEPSSETGERITKIPHGATVTVVGCPRPSNVGKMRGRWCQITYNGQSGWAFDAFMIFN